MRTNISYKKNDEEQFEFELSLHFGLMITISQAYRWGWLNPRQRKHHRYA